MSNVVITPATYAPKFAEVLKKLGAQQNVAKFKVSAKSLGLNLRTSQASLGKHFGQLSSTLLDHDVQVIALDNFSTFLLYLHGTSPIPIAPATPTRVAPASAPVDNDAPPEPYEDYLAGKHLARKVAKLLFEPMHSFKDQLAQGKVKFDDCSKFMQTLLSTMKGATFVSLSQDFKLRWKSDHTVWEIWCRKNGMAWKPVIENPTLPNLGRKRRYEP